jgi:uncharacterized protein (TIGR01777 family)
MNRVFITGGTGFLGTKLVNQFIKLNYTVFILSRSARISNIENMNYLVYNFDNPKLLADNFLDDDIIINLAGANISKIPWTKTYKEEIIYSRTQITEFVSAAIILSKKKIKLISASAIGIYGDRADEILTEKSLPGDGFLAEVCKKWEEANSGISQENKTVIRIGVVLDSKSGALPKMVLPFKFFPGSILGNGNQWLSWIHIDDIVNSILFIIENNLSGIYNLVSPECLSMRSFTKEIGKVLSRPVLFLIPNFVLKFIFGESSQILLNSQRVAPENLLKKGYHFKYSNVNLALMDLLKKNK